MKWIHRSVQVVTSVLEGFITLCFFVILLLTIILVILRYGFNETIIGGNEAMEYLFIYTTSIGAAAALGRREHIKITFLIDKLAPPLRKTVDVAGFLLISFINGVMISYSVPWIRTVGSFESPVIRLPNRTIQLIIPIGSGLVIIYCLYHILAILLKKPNELERGAQ